VAAGEAIPYQFMRRVRAPPAQVKAAS